MSADAPTRGSLVVRLGCRDDDRQLVELMARNPMPGAVTVASSVEPSFFDAIEVEGSDPRLIVGDVDGRIVGAGLATTRSVYVNGAPERIGYLSSLRIDPEARNSTGLARGFRFLRELHQENPGASRIHITTILEGNALARSILTSGKAGLPTYSEFARYRTLMVPLWPRPAPRVEDGIELATGGEVGPEGIVEFLNEVGRQRQFYPAYTVRDLAEPCGLLRGLRVSDFIVARRGGVIVGVMAAWDQSAFRRNVVVGYSGLMGVARRAVDVFGRLLPLPSLPAPGEAVKSVTAACVAVRNDDPRGFELMLKRMLSDLAAAGKSFLMLGFVEGDPLSAVAKRYIHFALRSRLYIAAWGDGQDELRGLDRSLVPYLELGSL